MSTLAAKKNKGVVAAHSNRPFAFSGSAENIREFDIQQEMVGNMVCSYQAQNLIFDAGLLDVENEEPMPVFGQVIN